MRRGVRHDPPFLAILLAEIVFGDDQLWAFRSRKRRRSIRAVLIVPSHERPLLEKI
jgi:hypothetical protein